ncbi:MAG: LysM peptidoglycan-binding domain-containing protein, partial [Candidatus Schmidhempelia sp.]|nr:LysM peptidoglycan-binding domain-containing protein [Candidatus Schmidhempelia sp.]
MSILFDKITQKKWTRALALSSLSISIIACTQSHPAKVHDISDKAQLVKNKPSIVTKESQYKEAYEYQNRPFNIQIRQLDNNDNDYVAQAPISTKTVTTKDEQGLNTVITTSENQVIYQRNYDEIPKGGYQGDSYTVKKGDTLFYIAWITGNDYRALAVRNNIKEPYDLRIGQILDVSDNTTVVVTQQTTTSTVTPTKKEILPVVPNHPTKTPAIKPVPKPDSTATKKSESMPKPVMQKPIVTAPSVSSNTKQNTTTTVTTTTTTTSHGNKQISNTTSTTTSPSTNTQGVATNIVWHWPARGRVIEKFSNATKGIDIGGSLGDKVMAAANGRVVYAGNALPGYGNLIIIKHN